MRVTDLLDRALPVQIAGKPFTLRRVSLRAILHILVRFSDQLDAFRRTDERDVEKLLESIDRTGLADLFAFLLDPYDPIHLRASMISAVSGELSVLVGAINDLPRIWNSFGLSRPDPGAGESTGGEGQEAAGGKPEAIPALLSVIDVVAERYGIDPMRVLDWPYEAFLTMTEVMATRIEGAQREELRRLLEALGHDPALADVPGVTYSPVPNPTNLEH
jgi:hypothetical protein